MQRRDEEGVEEGDEERDEEGDGGDEECTSFWNTSLSCLNFEICRCAAIAGHHGREGGGRCTQGIGESNLSPKNTINK